MTDAKQKQKINRHYECPFAGTCPTLSTVDVLTREDTLEADSETRPLNVLVRHFCDNKEAIVSCPSYFHLVRQEEARKNYERSMAQ